MSEFLLHLEEGGILMLLGIGVVMLFLVTMIGAMNIMSRTVAYLNKIFPEAVQETKKAASAVAKKLDDSIAVAIAAAISRKRA